MPIPEGQTPKQQLSCLTTFEIGKVVQRGHPNKEGKFSLPALPDGKYWIAARGKKLQAVYMVIVKKGVLLRSRPRFLVTREGLVNNKCDIEPIDLFFK